MSPDPAVAAAVELLAHPRSPKRRSGAKRLRKLGDPRAGPALLDALARELEDPRPWETQYQLVMALAECRVPEARGYLERLMDRSFEATMLYLALGDGVVRLRHAAGEPLDLAGLLATGNDMLIDGAFRAVAMLRLVPPDVDPEEVLAFAAARPAADALRFWPAAAAAGWSGPAVEAYLRDCATSPRADVARVAAASAAGKYSRHSPL